MSATEAESLHDQVSAPGPTVPLAVDPDGAAPGPMAPLPSLLTRAELIAQARAVETIPFADGLSIAKSRCDYLAKRAGGGLLGRARRRRKPMTAAQLRDKLACKVFGGKACR